MCPYKDLYTVHCRCFSPHGRHPNANCLMGRICCSSKGTQGPLLVSCPPQVRKSEALPLAPYPHPPKWMSQSIYPFCGLNTLTQKDITHRGSYQDEAYLSPGPIWGLHVTPGNFHISSSSQSMRRQTAPHPTPELPRTSAISLLLPFLTSSGTHSDGLGFRSTATFREETITHSSLWREE